jgi:hypothetical protein
MFELREIGKLHCFQEAWRICQLQKELTLRIFLDSRYTYRPSDGSTHFTSSLTVVPVHRSTPLCLKSNILITIPC